MIESKIIVCEASPRWGSELQRQFLSDRVDVKVFSLDTTLQKRVAQISEQIATIVVNAKGRVVSSFQFVSRLGDIPHIPIVFLVLPEADAALEWVFRDVGAVNVLVEPFRASELAKCCQKAISSCR